MASASSSMLPATISWFAALTVWPAPLGPTWAMVLPTTSRIGLAAAKSASVAPTMMDSVAFIAPGSPPDTGASMMRRPRSTAVLASSAVTSGRMEEKSITRVSGWALAKTPSSGSRTA